jgi:hypothetical protein
MTFAFDTGNAPARSYSGAAEDSQTIRIRTVAQARTAFNRIRAHIEAHECQDELAAYWAREDVALDALYLFDPHVAAELRDVFETHRAALLHGGVNRIVPDDPRRAVPGSPTKS